MTGWKHDRRSRHERGYGARWDKLRKLAMDRDDWLCQPCQREGRATPATECDHITPKSQGGTDHLGNLQAICTDCHNAKTAQEAADAQRELRNQGRSYVAEDGWPVEPKRWGYSIPHGLQPATCRVVVVFGRPASGKSTYVKASADKRDKVIDLDQIKVKVGGAEWDDDPDILRKAMRWRDMAIRGLSKQGENATAWLIVTGSTPDERAAWIDALGPRAEPVIIDTPADVCIERIKAEPKRAKSAPKMVEIASKWLDSPET